MAGRVPVIGQRPAGQASSYNRPVRSERRRTEAEWTDRLVVDNNDVVAAAHLYRTVIIVVSCRCLDVGVTSPLDAANESNLPARVSVTSRCVSDISFSLVPDSRRCHGALHSVCVRLSVCHVRARKTGRKSKTGRSRQHETEQN